jgi:hypothetical protein
MILVLNNDRISHRPFRLAFGPFRVNAGADARFQSAEQTVV